MRPDRGRRPGGRPAPWDLALAAVVVASCGIALVYGSLTPRLFAADEPVHVAYATTIEEGDLPSVDTRMPGSRHGHPGGGALSPGDFIYVANHPPLVPGVQAAASRLLEGTGLATDPELPVGRALNAAMVLASVLALAGLGRDLTGSRRTGVLAAALFAAAPALWSLATYGYGDGSATLATVLVTWAGVRAWRSADRRSLAWLGGAVALAGASRLSALITAVAVAAVVVGHAWLRPPGSNRSRPAPDAPLGPAGRRRLATAAGLAIGPATVLTAWWYVRNWVRFGDPAASAELVGRLARPHPSGGVLGRLADLGMWRAMATELTASTYSATYYARQPRLPAAAVGAIGVLAVVALVGLVLPERVRPRRPADPALGEGGGRGPARAAWVLVPVAIAGVVLGIALHAAGGGTPHPRYLIPALPLLALGAVAGLDRLHPRLAEAALAAAVVATLVVLRDGDRWMRGLNATSGQAPLGPDGVRTAGVALLVAAGALAVGAVAANVKSGRAAAR